MDTEALRTAYHTLLDAAFQVATHTGQPVGPPPGEWDAEQILAHVSLVSAATLAAVSTVTAGAHTTYDNRTSQDPWTITTTIAHAGGSSGLRDRIRAQADALCLLGGSTLGDGELDTAVPARLLSHGEVLLDQPIPLRDILNRLAAVELPGHTAQLLASVAPR